MGLWEPQEVPHPLGASEAVVCSQVASLHGAWAEGHQETRMCLSGQREPNQCPGDN